jgi:hypothetical protein
MTLRQQLRADIETVYKTASCCDDADIPTVAALAKHASTHECPVGALELIHRACNENKDLTLAGPPLLGLGKTRGWKLLARWQETATFTGHRNADSFRNGKREGQRRIDYLLDSATDELLKFARRTGFGGDEELAFPSVVGLTTWQHQQQAIVESRRPAEVDCFLEDVTLDYTRVMPDWTLTVEYLVLYRSWEPVTVWLGARLIDESGVEYRDRAGDTLVTVMHGSRVLSRTFTVGLDMPHGEYRMIGDLIHGESPDAPDAVRLEVDGRNECELTVVPKPAYGRGDIAFSQ